MAQKETTLTMNTNMFQGNAMANKIAMVHEPDTNPPYVGVFLAVQAAGGSSYDPTTGAGRLIVEAHYTDGSFEELTDDEDPFSTYSGSIPNQTEAWVLVHGNGKVAAESAPSDASNLTQSNTPAQNERLALAAGKTLSYIEPFWADDPGA